MNVGILLPTFRSRVDDALNCAHEAAQCGLDGVFSYDHLWPLGHRERPALSCFPLLARVAVSEATLTLGPLVARVGLVSNDQLVSEFATLDMLAPGRVIAALGTGDKLSAEENLAYGIAYNDAPRRREQLAEAVRALRDRHEVWVGAGSAATNDLARRCGVALNLWNRSAGEVRDEATLGLVNWAGDPRDDVENQLDALAAAGARWAVFSPRTSMTRLGAWRREHPHSQ